jgi:hypothetical protein
MKKDVRGVAEGRTLVAHARIREIVRKVLRDLRPTLAELSPRPDLVVRNRSAKG